MYSGRMRAARGGSHPRGVCLSACWDTPPRCGPGDPPGCGPGDPPGVGLKTPPSSHTPQLSPSFGPGDPHGDLQDMLGYHPPR